MSEQAKIKRYQELVARITPKSRIAVNCARSFWVGGVICVIGQLISIFGERALKLNLLQTAAFTPVVLVFLGTTLTGIGVYDRIGRYAGAGSIVPITGFANSVAAPAIEFRREGMVMGLGARLFQLAGPVLTYGITSSVLVGLIYWVIGRWFS